MQYELITSISVTSLVTVLHSIHVHLSTRHQIWPLSSPSTLWSISDYLGDVLGCLLLLHALHGQRLQCGEHVYWCLCLIQFSLGTEEWRAEVHGVSVAQNPVESAEIQTVVNIWESLWSAWGLSPAERNKLQNSRPSIAWWVPWWTHGFDLQPIIPPNTTKFFKPDFGLI